MKTKNSYPSSEFENKDKCPSCGSYCDIFKDLDENDECKDCRHLCKNCGDTEEITRDYDLCYKCWKDFSPDAEC